MPAARPRQSSATFERLWIDESVEVDAAPMEIHALLIDIDRWPSWVPGLRALRRVGHKPLRVDSRFGLFLAMPPLRFHAGSNGAIGVRSAGAGGAAAVGWYWRVTSAADELCGTTSVATSRARMVGPRARRRDRGTRISRIRGRTTDRSALLNVAQRIVARLISKWFGLSG